MKNKDTQLLEEAYMNVHQNEYERRQQEMDERLPHITKALEANKDLKFEDKKEFYRWQEKNLAGIWDYTDSDLHPELGPELQKAYEAGWNSEDYTNPFPEKSLWWWVAELSIHQGAMDV